MFHVFFLAPYKETLEHGPNFFDSLPDLVDGFKEYKVEKIIKHKLTNQGMKYLIRWKGYSPSDDTWKWEDNLKYSEELLRKYKATNKLPQDNAGTCFRKIKHKYCTKNN
ncbi:Chromodomain Y-like protein 2 [Leucoagaricus sp. SymC.cos]|nr:Chromodomain Y-like protein 2 [Leucoagaricus sp. SymC.cos]